MINCMKSTPQMPSIQIQMVTQKGLGMDIWAEAVSGLLHHSILPFLLSNITLSFGWHTVAQSKKIMFLSLSCS